ncbi:MAG: hypothetical protein H6704_06175 [Myxococcales bacterium]|nr:hypothetical protein [Myxococcales bacterium]
MDDPAHHALEIDIDDRAHVYLVDRGRASPVLEVRGGARVALRVIGLAPHGEVILRAGRARHRLQADERGKATWLDPTWLSAAAGRVTVLVEDGVEPPLRAWLAVRPTKLDVAAVRAMVGALEGIARGLASDLGGDAEHVVADLGGGEAMHPDAMLARLEQAVGVLGRVAPSIRNSPIHRQRERPQAVPARAPRMRARDVRWLARSPAALRIEASGRAVRVEPRVQVDLDLVENRGLVGLLGRLREALEKVEARLRAERDRLLAGRADREAFYTERGNLFSEQDLPRLQAVEDRLLRVEYLRGELDAAPARLGLPAGLRPAPRLPRTARVARHPGYWQLHRVDAALAEAGELAPPRVFAPTRNLDDLYEVWTLVALTDALCRRFGGHLDRDLRRVHDGWFVRLPRGEVWSARAGDVTWRLLYEPKVAYAGDGPLARITGGAELRPDAVLVKEMAGMPVWAHVFDAKHRRDRARADRAPWSAVEDIWLKYGEWIGRRGELQPLVGSVWVLYPAKWNRPVLAAPGMLHRDWPPDRLRGGAIPLLPENEEALGRVLDVLLGG